MKRTTTGISLLAVLLLGLAARPAAAQKDASYALVAGTVFRDTGFALPRADITLSAPTPPAGFKKFRPLKLSSDNRGEFAFRLPSVKADYTLTVRAEGYQEFRKDVTVGPDERVDVFIEMRPAGLEKK